MLWSGPPCFPLPCFHDMEPPKPGLGAALSVPLSLVPSVTGAQTLSQLVTSRPGSLVLADIWRPDPGNRGPGPVSAGCPSKQGDSEDSKMALLLQER